MFLICSIFSKTASEHIDVLEEEEADVKEADIKETPVALKDVLRLVEHSAKAVDHMNEHQFSTVWSQCSSNTYGKKICI